MAILDGEVVGCGGYEQAGAGSQSAEVAFTVADYLHNRGIGMLLREHLVSLGRGRGFRAFTAETLSENSTMLRVFADAGLQAQRSLADGVYQIPFPLPSRYCPQHRPRRVSPEDGTRPRWPPLCPLRIADAPLVSGDRVTVADKRLQPGSGSLTACGCPSGGVVLAACLA